MIIAWSMILAYDQQLSIAWSTIIIHDQQLIIAWSTIIIHDQQLIIAWSMIIAYDQQLIIAWSTLIIHDQQILWYKKEGDFDFFTYFTALESLKKLFIAAKCVKSQNHPPCNTIKFVDHVWSLINVDHAMINCWSCMINVDHAMINCWS